MGEMDQDLQKYLAGPQKGLIVSGMQKVMTHLILCCIDVF